MGLPHFGEHVGLWFACGFGVSDGIEGYEVKAES